MSQTENLTKIINALPKGLTVPPLTLTGLYKEINTEDLPDFFIVQEEWENMNLSHWDSGENKNLRMLRIKRKDKPPLSIMFYKDDPKGFFLSNTTKEDYPTLEMEKALDRTGYGVNWFVVPGNSAITLKNLRDELLKGKKPVTNNKIADKQENNKSAEKETDVSMGIGKEKEIDNNITSVIPNTPKKSDETVFTKEEIIEALGKATWSLLEQFLIKK